jgi:hypothetical protein
MRTRFGIRVAGALVLVAGMVHRLPAAETTGKESAAALPQRNYQALPGKVVGILAGNGQALMASEGRRGPANTLCFSRDGSSYQWVYVTVPEKPVIGALNVPVGEQGKTTKRFNSLSMASPETVKHWGLTEPYTLVEVEVNSGLGCPKGESFVATHMKVVEGTRDYPFKTTEVIDQLRKHYQSYLQTQDRAVAEAMSEVQAKVLKNRKPTGPREKSELLYVTWLPETQCLRVVFQTCVRDGAYVAIPEEKPMPASPKPSQPAASQRPGTTFGVRLGMAYEMSKTCKVQRCEPLPLQAFQEEVPPPAAARRNEQ